MWVNHHTKAYGMNQREVPIHEFGECSLRAVFGVATKQFAVGAFVHVLIVTRWRENRTARSLQPLDSRTHPRYSPFYSFQKMMVVHHEGQKVDHAYDYFQTERA